MIIDYVDGIWTVFHCAGMHVRDSLLGNEGYVDVIEEPTHEYYQHRSEGFS